jgi:hypothetical protein
MKTNRTFAANRLLAGIALSVACTLPSCLDDEDTLAPGAGGVPSAGSGATSAAAGDTHVETAGASSGQAGLGGETGEAGAPDVAVGGAAEGGVGASAGGGGAPEPVVPPDGPGLEFKKIALPGVSRGADFGFVPGRDDELLVLGLAGGVYHLRLGESDAELLGDIKLDDVFRNEGCGLFSLAFDPEFETNHYVYFAYCTSSFESRLSRHVFDSIETLNDATVEIMAVATEEEPDEDWHRFGSIGFEPDGRTMWAFLGDHFFKPTGQDTSDKFGSLLRFVPSRAEDEGGYTPARGNAFTEDEGDPTVYAYGFRSPWRGTLDRRGRYWIGDVGLVTFEEVNLITEAGQNFGWSREEGPCEDDCENVVDPKVYFGRSGDDDYTLEDPDTEPQVKRAVWVGDVYDSPSTDRYFGWHDDMLIFGDFFTGWVRGLRVDDAGKVTDDVFLGHLPAVAAFRTGPDGYLYALRYGSEIYRALPASD